MKRWKRLALLVILIVLSNGLSAQYVYTIKADSVKLTGCDSSELIIENHTQGIKGFLYNTGNGRTQFRKGLVKVNDSLYLIGADSLQYNYNAWLQGGNRWGTAGVLGTLDSNHLDLYTNGGRRGRITNTGNWLFGTTADNGHKVQVEGTSSFNGGIDITGTVGGFNNAAHTHFTPTVEGGTDVFDYMYGMSFAPTMNIHGDYQQAYGVSITPTYNLNGFTQHTDGVSAALYVKSDLAGIQVDQNTSYPGNTGQPLYLYQGGNSDKESILLYRNGNLTARPFIWSNDNRPAGGKNFIVPMIRSTIANPTAGGGVSLTMDRYYYGTEASIDMHYETTPDSTANENTSIAFNTVSNGARLTPVYINGANTGVGTNTPTAKLHLAAGSTIAGTAPLKLTSGPLLATSEAGAIEYLTDKAYLGITTGHARKEFTLNESPLASTAVPYVSSAGRLIGNSNMTYDDSYGTFTFQIPAYSYRGTGTAPMDDRIGINLNNINSIQALSGSNRSAPAPGIFFKGSGWSTDNAAAQNVQFATWMLVKGGTSAPSGIYTIAAKINGTDISLVEPYTDLYRLNSSGYANLLSGMCIGNIATVPTALLHLSPGASAAGKAPLKVTAGTLLSTPEEGAIEYDGTDLYLTENTTRYKLSKTLTGSINTNFGGGSLAAFSAVTVTLTVTGAATGNVVAVNANSGAVNPPAVMISAYVSSANTVTIRAYNASSSAVTLGSDTYAVKVLP